MGKRKLHSLIDKVYALPNLLLAWEKVRANRGAGGIDGHPAKTKVTSFKAGFDFLGFHLHSRFKKPRAKAIIGFKDQVRHLTRRQQGKNLDEVIQALNPVIRGWGRYFRGSNWKMVAEDLDAWIRMRLRSFVRKRVTVRSKYNALYTVAFFQKKRLVSLTSQIALTPC